MSSSSASPSSPSDGHESERPPQLVDESPFFKMAEEFKPQMVPATCCKMSEDSQDSHQGQDSSHSRWRQVLKSTAYILQISHTYHDICCSSSSGLGLSGEFSVPLSDHDSGSVSRPSTQVKFECGSFAMYGVTSCNT